jgi:hypothetical protein
LSTGAFTGPYTQVGSNLTFTSNVSGKAEILNTTVSGIGAEPFGDTTKYLDVLGGGSVTVTITGGASDLSFLWGSIDKYNTIQFFSGATSIGTFTGANITPLSATGCQTIANCTGYVTFGDKNELITSFVMTSSSNSFETDNFFASTPPVPEISTWAMMILGFFGIGLLGYRRSGLSFRFV